jgi:osmoprotectant transport system permease protein
MMKGNKKICLFIQFTTLAAIVRAGGFGDRILAGLAVNDSTLMLSGAIPAAILALLAQVILTPKRKTKNI